MYKRGTIVLVPFPFTDLSGTKVRPAIIVSKGKVGNDVIVVFITTRIKLKGEHIVLIKPTTENGLKMTSQIVCSKIATLEAKIVLGEIGVVDTHTLQSIDTELRHVLAL